MPTARITIALPKDDEKITEEFSVGGVPFKARIGRSCDGYYGVFVRPQTQFLLDCGLCHVRFDFAKDNEGLWVQRTMNFGRNSFYRGCKSMIPVIWCEDRDDITIKITITTDNTYRVVAAYRDLCTALVRALDAQAPRKQPDEDSVFKYHALCACLVKILNE
jgi:hypothetical protein